MDTKRFVIGTAVGASKYWRSGTRSSHFYRFATSISTAMNVGPGTGVARDPPSVAAFSARKIRHPTGIFHIDTDANPPQHLDTACA